jgi:hypothetical protein
MRKTNVLLIGIVMAISVCAVTAASASAAKCVKEAGTKFALCVGAGEELLEAGLFLITQEPGEPHKFAINLAVATQVECTGATGTASIEGELVMKGTVSFTGCIVSSANKSTCEVSKTISSAEIAGTLSLATETENGTAVTRTDLTLSEENAKGFATFSIKSIPGKTCTIAVTGTVKGDVLCYFLGTGQNIETPEAVHLLECVPGDTANLLAFAGKEANLTAEFEWLLLEPTEDALWSLAEGS